jgi:hypothetical protein
MNRETCAGQAADPGIARARVDREDIVELDTVRT